MSLFFDQNIESMRASRRFREKWELDSAKELLDEEGYQKYKEKLDYDVKNIPPAPKKYDDEETQRRFEEVWSLWQHAAVAPKRFSQLDEKWVKINVFDISRTHYREHFVLGERNKSFKNFDPNQDEKRPPKK